MKRAILCILVALAIIACLVVGRLRERQRVERAYDVHVRFVEAAERLEKVSALLSETDARKAWVIETSAMPMGKLIYQPGAEQIVRDLEQMTERLNSIRTRPMVDDSQQFALGD